MIITINLSYPEINGVAFVLTPPVTVRFVGLLLEIPFSPPEFMRLTRIMIVADLCSSIPSKILLLGPL